MLAMLLLDRMNTRRQNKKKQALKSAKLQKNALKDICRTCLSTEGLVSIFYDKETEKKRTDDLRHITGLEIRMNDGLSQKICTACIETLNTALKFRRTSRKADKKLRSLFTVKPEKKIPKSFLRTIIPKEENVVNNEVRIEIDNSEVPLNEVNAELGFDYDFGVDYQVENNEEVTDVNLTEAVDDQKTQPVKKKRHVLPNASSYKCMTCSKEFRMKATYKAHMRFHTNYCVCESCGKRCRNNNQLQEHKRARHGLGRIHSCAYCEYTSATKEALTIHERRHTGERPYICDHCGATFHRRSNLVQHIAIHLPEKNFQCDMCPKKLKSRKFLQIHKHNAHTGKKYGYLCPVCRHRFEKPNKVRAHTRRVHGLSDQEQGPICSKCPKRLKSRKFLLIHESKAHREKRYRYICPVCQDTFSRPGNVRHHLQRSHSVTRANQGNIEKIRINLPIVEEVHKDDAIFVYI